MEEMEKIEEVSAIRSVSTASIKPEADIIQKV